MTNQELEAKYAILNAAGPSRINLKLITEHAQAVERCKHYERWSLLARLIEDGPQDGVDYSRLACHPPPTEHDTVQCDRVNPHERHLSGPGSHLYCPGIPEEPVVAKARHKPHCTCTKCLNETIVSPV